jgi:hypothetical protein
MSTRLQRAAMSCSGVVPARRSTSISILSRSRSAPRLDEVERVEIVPFHQRDPADQQSSKGAAVERHDALDPDFLLEQPHHGRDVGMRHRDVDVARLARLAVGREEQSAVERVRNTSPLQCLSDCQRQGDRVVEVHGSVRCGSTGPSRGVRASRGAGS